MMRGDHRSGWGLKVKKTNRIKIKKTKKIFAAPSIDV
jgi:hypothetical protein